MRREIICIDAAKCNGCGVCISACAEGALALVNGKAVLRDERSCDGLGACIGDCPQGALTIETREAPEFVLPQQAVHAHTCPATLHMDGGGGCPGSGAGLQQWPIQLHLVSPRAPFFAQRELLVLSSCAPAAAPAQYERELEGRGMVMACPKLDRTDGYVEKLAAIMQESQITKVTVLRMEVPCCSGLTRMVQAAAAHCGRPVQVCEVIAGIPRPGLSAMPVVPS